MALLFTLSLAWTFFLGAAFAPRRSAVAASGHSCLCLMCKGGALKCCCTPVGGLSLNAACDAASPESLLFAAVPATLPAPFFVPSPSSAAPLALASVAPVRSATTRSPVPPESPPRFLS